MINELRKAALRFWGSIIAGLIVSGVIIYTIENLPAIG